MISIRPSLVNMMLEESKHFRSKTSGTKLGQSLNKILKRLVILVFVVLVLTFVVAVWLV